MEQGLSLKADQYFWKATSRNEAKVSIFLYIQAHMHSFASVAQHTLVDFNT